jgi:hypothetical protein
VADLSKIIVGIEIISTSAVAGLTGPVDLYMKAASLSRERSVFGA